ncbi:hypothetical protein HDV01_004832 [Terramyces sp. JEL0728]|nr:hypothetical protein HDV01_004832 [Terramyces sp. JEL0728]
MSGFVQHRNGQLVLNNTIFRFASFNTPNLHILEDPWQRISSFEQQDQLSSIAQLGGQVVRTYVFSIPQDPSERKHIKIISGFQSLDCKWQLNKDLMQDFDYALHLANIYNIKVIIPFIDDWEWFGGLKAFANLYGLDKREFFSNRIIRTGFKQLISQILNRRNTFSGVLYKDDPAILCWETGNEIEPNPEWTLDIAKYIKQLDANHLVMDASNGLWSEDVLQSEYIDIFTNHYYMGGTSHRNLYLMNHGFNHKLLFLFTAAYSAIGIYFTILNRTSMFYLRARKRKFRYSMIAVYLIVVISSFWLASVDFPSIQSDSLDDTYRFRLNNDLDTIKPYKKAFIVGEFGLTQFEAIRDFQDAFLQSACSGMLIWSLRFHSVEGGFRIHKENSAYSAYHYPGFQESDGFSKDEKLIMKSMVEINRKLGVARNLTVPDPPVLFEPEIVEKSALLKWRGAAGATDYSIKVQNSIIATKVVDSKLSGSVLYFLGLNKFQTPIIISVIGFGEWGQVESNAITIK